MMPADGVLNCHTDLQLALKLVKNWQEGSKQETGAVPCPCLPEKRINVRTEYAQKQTLVYSSSCYALGDGGMVGEKQKLQVRLLAQEGQNLGLGRQGRYSEWGECFKSRASGRKCHAESVGASHAWVESPPGVLKSAWGTKYFEH